MCVCVRERERERERETERDRDRDRERERQRLRHTERQRERERDRQTDRQRDTERDKQTDKQTDRDRNRGKPHMQKNDTLYLWLHEQPAIRNSNVIQIHWVKGAGVMNLLHDIDIKPTSFQICHIKRHFLSALGGKMVHLFLFVMNALYAKN